MSTDFDTLLRETESSVPQIDAAAVIERADQRRRHRHFAIGAGVAAALLVASGIGWSVSRIRPEPIAGSPGPVTTDCVASQRRSLPPGELVKSQRAPSADSAPIGQQEVHAPGGGLMVVRVTQRPDGTMRMERSTDVRTSGMSYVAKADRKFVDLDVVGGGPCGLTVFADGDRRYLAAPVSPDASTVRMSGGWMSGGPLLLADGTLIGLAESAPEGMAPPVTVNWVTADGGVVNNEGDDIKTLRQGEHVVSVNVTKNRYTLGDAEWPIDNDWPTLPMRTPYQETDGRSARTTFIVPAGARDVTYRVFSDGAKPIGGGPDEPASATPIPGTKYSAILIKLSDRADTGRSLARIDWTDASGKRQKWVSSAKP
ncbi:hypothetical protein [Yimella sp. cx-51]|uniref:hypothetical protein n=1 Tax=Yimella sp. cx-51 TaxID=2770551 RepID=UPI00165D4397|nr:hypothetical protein [Yimella sp. cx-51]MBC9957056.1 hypothetical protein [Yimella sp. cx-51]QTH37278.1 hypothetical protein J5M86_10325 [Yimella sp. cx-51]